MQDKPVQVPQARPRRNGLRQRVRDDTPLILFQNLPLPTTDFHVYQIDKEASARMLYDVKKPSPQQKYAVLKNSIWKECDQKMVIVDMLKNPSHVKAIIDEDKWMMSAPPAHPPRIRKTAVFAYFVNTWTLDGMEDCRDDLLGKWTKQTETETSFVWNSERGYFHEVVAGRNAEYKLVEMVYESDTYPWIRKTICHIQKWKKSGTSLKKSKKMEDEDLEDASDEKSDGTSSQRSSSSKETQNNGDREQGADRSNFRWEKSSEILLLFEYTEDGPEPSLTNTTEIVDERPLTLLLSGRQRGTYYELKARQRLSKAILLDYMHNDRLLQEEVAKDNDTVPDTPPLVGNLGTFVYFVPVHKVSRVNLRIDGLSPWNTDLQRSTTSVNVDSVNNYPLVAEDDGALSQKIMEKKGKKDGRGEIMKKRRVEATLVEIVSVLARCTRLRRRLLYIENRHGELCGNVCYVYDFIRQGPLPEVSKPRGDLSDETIRKDIDRHREAAETAHTWREQCAVVEDRAHGLFSGYGTTPSGHRFAKVPINMKIETVLELLANDAYVSGTGLLNSTKPLLPPVDTETNAYAFFVARTSVYQSDINKDGLTRWNKKAKAYQVNSRRQGLEFDKSTGIYTRTGAKYWSDRPYYLVFTTLFHPKAERLRKKIYYIMCSKTNTVARNGLIVYEYFAPGDPVVPESRLQAWQGSLFNENLRRMRCDGTFYLEVLSNEVWSSRDLQVDLIYKMQSFVDELGCLNKKVPRFPPLCNNTAMFAFFVNPKENPNFYKDDLTWSREKKGDIPAIHTKTTTTNIPPAKAQIPGVVGTDYRHRLYDAKLPKCTRIRKRVVSMTVDGQIQGHVMILFKFDSDGSVPEKMMENALSDPYQPHPPTPPERSLSVTGSLGQRGRAATEYTNADGSGPSTSSHRTSNEHQDEEDELIPDSSPSTSGRSQRPKVPAPHSSKNVVPSNGTSHALRRAHPHSNGTPQQQQQQRRGAPAGVRNKRKAPETGKSENVAKQMKKNPSKPSQPKSTSRSSSSEPQNESPSE